MKMKSRRKVESDRVKRESSRNRARDGQTPDDAEEATVEDAVEELDIQVARSLQGYDE